MNKTATAFISFVLGAAAGSAATWYFLKDKYAAIANEEIQEVRDYYKGKYEPESMQSDSPQTKTEEIKASIDKLVINKISEQHDYTAYSKPNDKKTSRKQMMATLKSRILLLLRSSTLSRIMNFVNLRFSKIKSLPITISRLLRISTT